MTTTATPPAQAAPPNADGSPAGHHEAMAAKADARVGTAPIPGTLPPEFLATYETWKAAQGKPADAPKSEEKPAETPPPADPNKPLTVPEKTPETVEEAAKVVEGAGLKMDELTAEFSKDGKLSDASYDKLSKAGIPKEMVDGFIAGQQAIAEKGRTDLLNHVGGEKAFNDMAAWATANVPKADIEGINRALGSNDPAIQKLALDGLKARYTAAVGTDPSLLRGGSGVPSGSETFASRAQHIEAMRDPRYTKDPAYRREVEMKALRSTY